MGYSHFFKDFMSLSHIVFFTGEKTGETKQGRGTGLAEVTTMARSTKGDQQVVEIPATMTCKEVMDCLHISRATCGRMVETGELVAYWIGSHRKMLIDKQSVLQYFQTPANADAVDHREGVALALA